jgi:hypothetical protein
MAAPSINVRNIPPKSTQRRVNVRLWHKADVAISERDVCFLTHVGTSLDRIAAAQNGNVRAAADMPVIGVLATVSPGPRQLHGNSCRRSVF